MCTITHAIETRPYFNRPGLEATSIVAPYQIAVFFTCLITLPFASSCETTLISLCCGLDHVIKLIIIYIMQQKYKEVRHPRVLSPLHIPYTGPYRQRGAVEQLPPWHSRSAHAQCFIELIQCIYMHCINSIKHYSTIVQL